MSLLPLGARLQWDTVQLVGGQIRVTLKDGDYTEFSAETARQILAAGLSSDDVRAIVRDELARRA